MRQKLDVQVVRSTGMVYAQVPPLCMWELVNHLCELRIPVSYHFMGTHFTVRFPNTPAEKAQQLLNDWAQEATEHQAAVAV